MIKKKNIFLYLLMCCVCVHNLLAVDTTVVNSSQQPDTIRPFFPTYGTPPKKSKPLVVRGHNYLDTLYTRSNMGTLQLPPYFQDEKMSGRTFRDTLFYNPLFLPPIFTGNMLPDNISLYSDEDSSSKGVLIDTSKTFAPQIAAIDFRDRVRRYYYHTNPQAVRYTVDDFDESILQVRDEDVRESFNPFRDLLQSETNFTLSAPDVDKVVIKRRYWVWSGEHSLQFSQNYMSSNWHQSGNNHMNINSFQAIRANYKRDKVRFNNSLEWRLSVFQAPDDSLRQYRLGDDLIRYYGEFGVESFVKNWSYSMNLEARSQLFKNYQANTTNLRASFLSPLYVNAGVGLKYQLDKRSQAVRHRRTRINLQFAPISIDYKYVQDDAVDRARFGIPEGMTYNLDLGSTITGELIYDHNRYITWTSRLKYFTSYHKSVGEWENTLNMALTNAFSTRIYLNVRHDDGVPPDPKFGYWQIKEVLSFGLNYKW